MEIDGVEVRVEGEGSEAVVMIHGWPDTLRLWDGTVESLKPQWRCVRLTLPGFDPLKPARACSLDEVVETLRAVVSGCCPGERVTLLAHDWGCLFAYEFAMRHPRMVSRIVGVDIGDTGSKAHRAELSSRAKVMLLAYQLWLAVAWRLGGALGDRMVRTIAGPMRCPVPPQRIRASTGYPYAMRWFGLKGGFRKALVFAPQVPMLYVYGQRKAFMFHSQAWIEALARRPGSRVVALRTGHWVMLDRAQEFHAELVRWLGETGAVSGR